MTETDATTSSQTGPELSQSEPPRCPFGRHHTFDGQTRIVFGYEDLTAIMERILDIWDYLEASGVTDAVAGDLFEGLLGHLEMTRRWTGWDGVPGKYLR
jgi:hypothetical protein